MILTTFFCATIVLGLWLPSRGNTAIIIFAVLYGFSSGTFVSLIPALVAQVSNIREIGVRNGTGFFVISVAGLVGSPIGGALVVKDEGRYTYLQVFCGLAMFVGACLFVVARYLQCGFKWKKI